MTRLQTSPLLFLRPALQSELEGRRLDCSLSLSEIEILSFFAEARSVEEAIDAGFKREAIEGARQKKLLVDTDENGLASGSNWEIYNLQRAAFLMFNCMNSPAEAAKASFLPVFGADRNELDASSFASFFHRRTERFFLDEPLDPAMVESIASDLNAAINETDKNNWLSFRFLIQDVVGVARGVYSFDSLEGKLVQCIDHYTRKDLLECLHGQWWLNGGGFCCFFVVSLKELMKQAGSPQNYFEMIVLLGEAGQALVNSVTKHELGTWMTPALSESQAAEILQLNSDEEESLYFFKVGRPERAAAAAEERRSPI